MNFDLGTSALRRALAPRTYTLRCKVSEAGSPLKVHCVLNAKKEIALDFWAKPLLSQSYSYEVDDEVMGLQAGLFDTVWVYEWWAVQNAKLQDYPVNYFAFADMDPVFDYYTPVIITSESMIEKNPETVRKFLAAAAKGYEYAISNPEESAKILQQYAPDYDLDMLTISQEYLSPKYAEDAPRWGEMKDEVWNGYTDLLVEYGVLPEAIPAARLYTNEFLPEAK